MNSIENLLPNTKLYRDTLRSALQTHNIKVKDHKTRNYHGNFWDLCIKVGARRDSYMSYHLIRTVTFWLEKSDEVPLSLVNTALADVQIWAALCGTHLVMEIDTDKDHWRIKTACVI